MTARDRPSVLVIDDNRDLLELYTHQLGAEYRVRTAASGEAALRDIDDDVDVVILDRRMDDLSGSDVLERLRDRGFDQPVAMVTAVEPDVDIVDMEFDDYLVKPVDGAQLRDLVETLCLRREYDDVIREHFALVSKLAALEEQKSRAALEASEAYSEALDRLGDIEEESRAALEAAIDRGVSDERFTDAGAVEEDVVRRDAFPPTS